MATPSKRAVARAVLERFPESPADALRIDVGRDTPAPLFQWLVASLLFSARISADLAQAAAQALFREGWRTPAKMAQTRCEDRVSVLNAAGYARYDESAARYLGETTTLLLERYGGDLRKLRAAASRDPVGERKRLKDFKGIGDVGVDIFFREAQLAWDELYPFADKKALKGAEALGLDVDAKALSRLAPDRRDFPRLLAGLARVAAKGGAEEIRLTARG